MSTRRPRIKVRPNVQRARAPADGAKSPDHPPTEADESVQERRVSSKDSKNSRLSTTSATSRSSSAKIPPAQTISDGSTEVTGVPDEKTQSQIHSGQTNVSRRRPRIKVQPNLNAGGGSGKSAAAQTKSESSTEVTGATDEKTPSQIPSGQTNVSRHSPRIKVQPNLNAGGDSAGAASRSGVSPVDADTDLNGKKDESNLENSSSAKTISPAPERAASGKRRPRLKIQPNLSCSSHKPAAEVADDQTVESQKDVPDGGQPENSVLDQPTEFSLPEQAVAEEVMKSPTRRARFIRAKPNIAEAERRHQRLSSLSESDDPGTLWKYSGSSEKPGTELKSPENPVTAENTANVEVNEKKKQPRIRRHQSVKLEKSVSENRRSFTISDLIHMNPVSNPMKRYLNKEKKKTKGPEEKLLSPLSATSKVNSSASCQSGPAATAADIVIDDDNDDEDNKAGDDSAGGDAMPVPQVMLGPDGNIVLNDASLTIKNVDAEPDSTLIESEVVVDNDNYDPSMYYKTRKRSHTWTIRETRKFYVALSCLGTDFSLMEKLFPKRDRGELKRKFKLEEKKHRALIDKALSERLSLDMSLFDSSDEDDDGDENGAVDKAQASGDEYENIANTVKGVLETEKEEVLAKRRNNAKIQKNRKNELKSNNPAESTVKKKKNGWRSRYYECSGDESDEEVKAGSDSGKQHEPSSDDMEAFSDDEKLALQHIIGTITRAGRQTKRNMPFTLPEERVRKRRAPDSTTLKAPKPSSEISQLDPMLAPLICTPPVGASHKMLEDTETGQRLLLVKSPPPFASSGSSEFVHVYLMSPRQNQDDSAQTRHDSAQSRHSSNNFSAVSQASDETDVFIPPPVFQVRRSESIQEEVITDELRLIGNSGIYRETGPNMSEQADSFNDVQVANERTSSLTSPHTVQISDYRTNVDVSEANVTGPEHVQDVMDVYENAEITTLTNDKGQIIEILIDPGL